MMRVKTTAHGPLLLVLAGVLALGLVFYGPAAAQDLSIPAAPDTSAFAAPTFDADSGSTIISLYPPTTDIGGNLLPEDAEVEFDVVRYYFPENDLGAEEGWVEADYTGLDTNFDVRDLAEENRWVITDPIANLSVDTPVDCLEPRLILLAARARLVGPELDREDWPASPWTLANLSFRYAAEGEPGSTGGCDAAMVRYPDAATALAENGLAPVAQPEEDSRIPVTALPAPAPMPREEEVKPQVEEAGPESITVLIDASGSMADDGKIDDAKAAARTVLTQIEPGTEVALVVFYDCNDIRVEQEYTDDVELVLEKIDAIVPDADTPLADAILFARNFIVETGTTESVRLVILSDGMETCGGDPVAAAEATADETQVPIDVDFFVIGFEVDAATTQQLQQVAAAGRGRYFDARDQRSLESAFGESVGVDISVAVETEVEPNDRMSEANVIAPKTSVAGAINPERDGDIYLLSIDQAGELQVLITDVAPELDVVFRVWNADFDVIADWTGPLRAGGNTEGVVDLPAPGEYRIEVRDGGDNAASNQPYTLQTIYTPIVDVDEPNNSFGQAGSLVLGEVIQGTILPRRDSDWYRFEVQDRGELYVLISEVVPELDVVFRVWNANRDVIWDWVGPLRAGGDTEAFVDLPGPGEYTLEVRDGGDDSRSVVPYTLETAFVPVIETVEPNDSFGQTSPLELDQAVQGTILPRRDSDWYRFQVPGRSEVQVLISDVPANLDVVFRVWNANRDVIWDWQAPLRVGGDTEATVDLPDAGEYTFEVRDGSDDDRSVEPYTLQTLLTLAADATENNDSFGMAQLLYLGTDVQGSILPRRDHDWYRVMIPTQSQAEITITSSPKELDMAFRVWNADREVVLDWQRAAAKGGDVTATAPIEEPGLYAIEVADGSDDARSPLPYTLTVNLLAQP